MPLELPAGEDPSAWASAAGLADLELGPTGTCPWVRFVPQGGEWVVQVCDGGQAMRQARISAPRTANDREAAVLLAGSLLQSAKVAPVAVPELALPAPPTTTAPVRTRKPSPPPPEEEPEPRFQAGVSATPEGADPVGDDDLVEIGLNRGRKRTEAELRDAAELEENEDDLLTLEAGATGEGREPVGTWWSVLVGARTWDRSNPGFGGRLRLGTTLRPGLRVGLEGYLGAPRTLNEDALVQLRDRSAQLGAYADLPGTAGAWADLRAGVAWVTPVYEREQLDTLTTPVLGAGIGLPIAEGDGWAAITELGAEAHLRGVELRWPDGRSSSMALWQVELGVGVRLGGR